MMCEMQCIIHNSDFVIEHLPCVALSVIRNEICCIYCGENVTLCLGVRQSSVSANKKKKMTMFIFSHIGMSLVCLSKQV